MKLIPLAQMKKAICGILAVSWLSLSGCSLCLLECARPVDRTLKPRGAHWVKDGMTKESRQADFALCGGGSSVHIGFTNAQIEAERQPGDLNEFAARNRLSQKWAACMKSKGYVHLEHCDERCLYP